ncbi:MAG: T9SS type A sorting domain-containing protein [Flavobacteriales bacterium]|nr:T9SS type A sorting domain-containing protein [Flavobacteriales bacterium]
MCYRTSLATLITLALPFHLVAQSPYCIPVHGSQFLEPIVLGVSLGAINNQNSAVWQTPSGYSDFTGLSTPLAAGTTQTLTVQSGAAFQYNYAAWIDYDHDGEFLGLERIGLVVLNNYASGTITFNVPQLALIGPTRLRIRAVAEPFGPWTQSNDPCVPFLQGECEDYTVDISGGVESDIGVAALVQPITAVGLGMEPVRARIVNYGSAPADDFSVSFSLDGVLQATAAFTDTLWPGEDTVYTFSASADMSAPGCRTVTVTVDWLWDDLPDNDAGGGKICNLEPVAGTEVWYIHSNSVDTLEPLGTGPPWYSTTNSSTLNTVFGAGGWHHEWFETVDPEVLLSPATCFIFIDGSYGDTDPLFTWLDDKGIDLQNWVAAGGHLFLNCDPNSQDVNGELVVDLGFDGVKLVQGYPISYARPVPGHGISGGPYLPVGNEWGAFYYAQGVLHGGDLDTAVADNDDDHFLGPELSLPLVGDKTWGDGHVLFGTIGASQFFNDSAEAMNSRANMLAFLDQCATTTTDERDAGITDHVLWPNPSSGIVRLTTGNTGANARIEVRDALGQVVRTYQASALGSGPWTMDLSGLARGLYHVNMADGEQQVSIALALVE